MFDRYDILSHIKADGRFLISASQIKEYREPRLMAKFDHRINLPQIFQKHRLAILPLSRSEYVISHFEAYEPFQSSANPVSRAFLPASLQSLDAGSIPSEAIAINCALASGILSDFLGEEALHPTVSGRMGSGSFDFYIQNCNSGQPVRISVNNAQIEIDAAFEGAESLALIEAKRDLSEDFLVRQLYYPFHLWNSRVTKKVRPVFLVYSNGIFRLYEYSFEDADSYNSLTLVQHKRYSIEDTRLRLSDLREAAKSAVPAPEPEVPFPQANEFERIINLCELLDQQDLSKEQVTEQYAFDMRQTNYYTDAARYLGLADRRYEEGRKPVYFLTPEGKRILRLGYRQRQLAFCRAILGHRPFREVLEICLETGYMPGTETIVEIMRSSGLYKVESGSTYQRRASTISRWVSWMLELTAERQASGW
ncbi:MAG: transcriptional regulator [Firmicutes bacterium]|nr:transcriptional regulator [Bacillota bacterium]